MRQSRRVPASGRSLPFEQFDLKDRSQPFGASHSRYSNRSLRCYAAIAYMTRKSPATSKADGLKL